MMNEKRFFKLRLYFTAIVTISICGLLAWDYFHKGIPAHHILADPELPLISNAWGALLLPLLSWFLLYRISKRAFDQKDGYQHTGKFLHREGYGFVGALLFGILLSVFFTSGNTEVPGYMVMSLFPLALFFPVYRAEYLLGFVIGMTFTFGAVLPTGFGSILVLIAAVLYLYVRRAILFVFSKLRSA